MLNHAPILLYNIRLKKEDYPAKNSKANPNTATGNPLMNNNVIPSNKDVNCKLSNKTKSLYFRNA